MDDHATDRTAASRRVVALELMAIAGLLAGCAVVPDGAPRYREPPRGVAAAKLRVVNLHPQVYYAEVAVFDAPACFIKANLGRTGGNSRDAERIGMLGDRPASPATLERYVRADETLVLGPRAVFPTVRASELAHVLQPETQDALRARQAGVCRVPSFVPKAGEQYEVDLDLTPGRCVVTPYRLVSVDGKVAREPVPAQESRISTYEFDFKCFK